MAAVQVSGPRRLLGAAAAAAAAGAAALVLAACGSSHGGTPALVNGSFVAAVPGTQLYVAVVAAPARPGAGERAIRAYVCDGRRVSEWFPGRGANAAGMRSDSGKARVHLTLHQGAASGTIVLADGKSVDFRAARATGIAGLYDSMLLPDGSVRGSSETGARLEGRRVSSRPDRSGRFKAVGTYIEPDGKTTPWVTFARARLRNRPIESRVIVLSDGRRRGAYKRSFRPVFIENSQPQ